MDKIEELNYKEISQNLGYGDIKSVKIGNKIYEVSEEGELINPTELPEFQEVTVFEVQDENGRVLGSWPDGRIFMLKYLEN